MDKENRLSEMFSSYGKVPPQATDLEEAVLGTIMQHKGSLIMAMTLLKPEVFYKDAHRILFTAITNLFDSGNPVDVLTVTSELKKTSELEMVGGTYQLSQLTNILLPFVHVEYHCRIILQKYFAREVIRLGSDAVSKSYEDSTDIFELIDDFGQRMIKITSKMGSSTTQHIKSVSDDNMKYIREAAENNIVISGIPTGYTKLDGVTHGFQDSDLIIIAARPGMGKTALLLSMVKNIAIDQQIPCGICSLEMSSKQLEMRMKSMLSGYSIHKMRSGLNQSGLSSVANATEIIKKSPIIIDDEAGITIQKIRSKAIEMVMQFDIKILFIDYLQLCSGGGKYKGNRESEIAEISRGCKSIAKELDIPVVALSQLNRSVETRGGDKRPILSDLRESGSIEQDSDMVIFLYRPEYYGFKEGEDGEDLSDVAELNIAKHRNGALLSVHLKWVKHLMQFVDNKVIEGGEPDQLKIDENLKPDENTPF